VEADIINENSSGCMKEWVESGIIGWLESQVVEMVREK
jgi:hypothetical protein